MIMKPWNDSSASWKTVTGHDFYFALDKNEDGPYVAITPQDFFDRNGYWWDQHLEIDHILPPYLACSMEGIYEWPNGFSKTQVRKALTSRGFVENTDLVKKS